LSIVFPRSTPEAEPKNLRSLGAFALSIIALPHVKEGTRKSILKVLFRNNFRITLPCFLVKDLDSSFQRL
jgi:hypothetical protein